MFCQGHVGVMVHAALEKTGRANDRIVAFGLQYIPWQSKIIELGCHAHLVGAKTYLNLATTPQRAHSSVARLISILFEQPCRETPFIATALTTSNQILHPACYFGVLVATMDWDGHSSIPNDGQWGEGSLYMRMNGRAAAILASLKFARMWPDGAQVWTWVGLGCGVLGGM